MLSNEQSKNITYVYSKLLQSELSGWAEIDDCLEQIEWLSDDELFRECELLYSYQKNGNVSSRYKDDSKATLFIRNLIEASDAILELYKETNNLHSNNRYILSYYLGLCQTGQIVLL